MNNPVVERHIRRSGGHYNLAGLAAFDGGHVDTEGLIPHGDVEHAAHEVDELLAVHELGEAVHHFHLAVPSAFCLTDHVAVLAGKVVEVADAVGFEEVRGDVAEHDEGLRHAVADRCAGGKKHAFMAVALAHAAGFHHHRDGTLGADT